MSAIIALCAFSTAFFVTHKQEADYRAQSALAIQTAGATQNPTDIDTDYDGLPDWKERLYGSDINNPDTDGDGTNDGAEVRLGRNPVMPNTAGRENSPNDKFTYLQDPNFATSTSDMLGIKKDFFAQYLALVSQNIKETTFLSLIK